ncbi:MAG: GIY-YIG nuclease family protein [Alphaproteobacteria bacterium]|nr:GIY-YIG nuclease family protein [Alphaproteobacteria bacterium]
MYVYIMSNKNNNVLYIGVTNDLIRRIYEHKNKILKGFTSKYNVEKLVYYECFEDELLAIQREKNLKNWHKEWKENLIRQMNPEWKDLYEDICK